MGIELIPIRADAFYRKMWYQESLRAKADVETFTTWQVAWVMGSFKIEYEAVNGSASEKKLSDTIRLKVPFMKVT